MSEEEDDGCPDGWEYDESTDSCFDPENDDD
jgi:hypothetical protein